MKAIKFYTLTADEINELGLKITPRSVASLITFDKHNIPHFVIGFSNVNELQKQDENKQVEIYLDQYSAFHFCGGEDRNKGTTKTTSNNRVILKVV